MNFHPPSTLDAESIAQWRYTGEYAVYDTSTQAMRASVEYMTDPNAQYFGAYEGEELVGFCSIGIDGQVPGGDYDDSAVDIGAGMRPDLVGRRGGVAFLRGVVDFVESEIGRCDLRATIASWNERALRVASAVGFIPRTNFIRSDGVQFTVVVRVAENTRIVPPNTPMEPTAEQRGGSTTGRSR